MTIATNAALPAPTETVTFFSVDDILTYVPFFADFGPLNLGQVRRSWRVEYSCRCCQFAFSHRLIKITLSYTVSQVLWDGQAAAACNQR